MYDYRFTGSYELPVQFSDTEAKVFIYIVFTEKYYIALMIFDVGFSLMMGIVFVYLRIRKIISGYQTELEETQSQEKKARQEKQNIAVNIGLISRIFTNLTDNICKYADIDKTIVMETSFSKNNFKVKIGNGICDDKTLLESTGIGLKSVDMMMLRMNGSMSYSRERGMFWAKLEFPIVK